MMGQPRIGIDLGGTKIEGVILDDLGNVVFRQRVRTPKNDFSATTDAIAHERSSPSLLTLSCRDLELLEGQRLGVPS